MTLKLDIQGTTMQEGQNLKCHSKFLNLLERGQNLSNHQAPKTWTVKVNRHKIIKRKSGREK
jgi:hypothetical protein